MAIRPSATDEQVNVEFVSANPTGPMHVGHGRGAVVGDALAALAREGRLCGHREYYINDAGAQVDALGRSLYLRYQEVIAAEPESRLLHSSGVMHAGAGAARGLLSRRISEGHRTKAVRARRRELVRQARGGLAAPVRDFAIAEMMALIRDDLAALGVDFDAFVSERALVESGAVDAALAALTERGLIYEGVLEPPKGKTAR